LAKKEITIPKKKRPKGPSLKEGKEGFTGGKKGQEKGEKSSTQAD